MPTAPGTSLPKKAKERGSRRRHTANIRYDRESESGILLRTTPASQRCLLKPSRPTSNLRFTRVFGHSAKDAVIAGPLETFGRKVTALPTADSTSTRQIRTRKAPVPVRVLYGKGDHTVAEDKKLRWVPEAFIIGTGPATTSDGNITSHHGVICKTYGALSLKIDNWRASGWGHMRES